jgi:hypothetical protein
MKKNITTVTLEAKMRKMGEGKTLTIFSYDCLNKDIAKIEIYKSLGSYTFTMVSLNYKETNDDISTAGFRDIIRYNVIFTTKKAAEKYIADYEKDERLTEYKKQLDSIFTRTPANQLNGKCENYI